MATELQIWDHTFLAAADLTTLQFRIVKLMANKREVNVATAAADALLGVNQEKPSAVGRPTSVRLLGISKVVAGAAITIHSAITSDGFGRAIATTTAGNSVLGYALEAATAIGDIITVLILPGRKF